MTSQFCFEFYVDMHSLMTLRPFWLYSILSVHAAGAILPISGLMTEKEYELLLSGNQVHGNYFQPVFWCLQLATLAKKEGRIHDEVHLKTLFDVNFEEYGYFMFY